MQTGRFLGEQFGNYRIILELARGGFGTVYLAEHTLLTSRQVAIKVLHGVLLNAPGEREAFLQEAQFLERLKHPFILPLLDVGIQQHIPFLITEYAAAGSLRYRLQTRAPQVLPLQESLAILSQIGQALTFAHQQTPAIIHRDLKPDNIFFNARGEAILADFGIATLLSTTSIRLTSTTGTPVYMAPEQFRGYVSRGSDQYSLGCIAYELFTGQPPFMASDFVALGFKHATEQPIPPTQLNPNLPRFVEEAVLKALAKQREGRHADVTAFVTALQGLAHSQQSHVSSSQIHVSAQHGTSFVASAQHGSALHDLAQRTLYKESLGKLELHPFWEKAQQHPTPATWHILREPYSSFIAVGRVIWAALCFLIMGAMGGGGAGVAVSQVFAKLVDPSTLTSLVGVSIIVGFLLGIGIMAKIGEDGLLYESGWLHSVVVLIPDGFIQFTCQGGSYNDFSSPGGNSGNRGKLNLSESSLLSGTLISYQAVKGMHFNSTTETLTVMTPSSSRKIKISLRGFDEVPHLIAQRIAYAYTHFHTPSSLP